MARVTVVADTNETRSPYTVVNSIIADYQSQTDTTQQSRASNLSSVGQQAAKAEKQIEQAEELKK